MQCIHGLNYRSVPKKIHDSGFVLARSYSSRMVISSYMNAVRAIATLVKLISKSGKICKHVLLLSNQLPVEL